MPLSLAPFPEQNLGPLQQALAQSQNQLSQNTAAQVANSQFAQKLDMQAQQAGREEAANAIHQAFALAAQAKMNEAKLQMERETNQNNKEINLLKLAMAQKESEATQAYREAQLKISQQNADTSRYRAENPPQRAGKTPSATDKVNANLSDWLGGAVPPANTTPTTGESPNPLLPPPAADATTPPEAINKPETIPIVPATPTAPAAPAAPVSPTAPAVAKPDAQPSVAPPNVSPGLAALMDATAMQKPATPAAPPVVADAKPGAPLADLTLTKPDLTVTPPAAPVQEEHPPAIVEKAAKTMSNAQFALAQNYVNSLKPGETPGKGVVAQWAVGIGSANSNSGPVSIVINKMLADKYKKDAESKSAEAEKTASSKADDAEEALFRKQMASADQAVRNAPPEKKAALRDKYDNFVVGGKSISTKIFNDLFGEGSAVTQNNELSAVKTQIGIVKSQLAGLVKARDRKLLFARTAEEKKKVEAESGVARAKETYDSLVSKSLELSGLGGAVTAPVPSLPSGNPALDSYNALRSRLPK